MKQYFFIVYEFSWDSKRVSKNYLLSRDDSLEYPTWSKILKLLSVLGVCVAHSCRVHVFSWSECSQRSISIMIEISSSSAMEMEFLRRNSSSAWIIRVHSRFLRSIHDANSTVSMIHGYAILKIRLRKSPPTAEIENLILSSRRFPLPASHRECVKIFSMKYDITSRWSENFFSFSILSTPERQYMDSFTSSQKSILNSEISHLHSSMK